MTATDRATDDVGVMRRLVALFASAGILIAGNTLLVTMIAIRSRAEGYGDAYIGLIGTLYFLGYLVGAIANPRLIQRAGHIRVFAAMAAIAATSVLVMLLFVDPWVWMVARVVTGFAYCGCLMSVESWINSTASNDNRGRILSTYRMVDLGANTLGQFLLPVIGVQGFQIFVIIGMFFALALIPVSLSTAGNPAIPPRARVKTGLVWTVSPVAAATCLTIGLTNGAFRTVGPVYAQSVGLGVEDIALFISLWIIGGAVFQFPLGIASDRFDRRRVMVAASIGAGVASLFISQATESWMILVGAFVFGGFGLPLYSLASAHANDHAKSGQHVDLAAGLFVFFTSGAVIGPLLASLIIAQLGPGWFFVYTAILHFALIGFVLFRMLKRAPVPRELRRPAVWLLRNSPMFNRMVAQGGRRGRDRPDS